MEITSLRVKEINKIKVGDSLKAPVLRMSVKLDKNTVVPNNNNLIIYVKQGSNIKEYTFAITSPLGYLKNISDEFVISPTFNGEKVELSAFVNRNIGTNKTKENLVYKPIVLFEGSNEIYTNYENAIIEVSYPKDTEMVYYFLSNVMTPKNTGGTSSSFDVDLVYPVGSIYMSTVSTDPSSLFGGTWQRIKDTFLLASGDRRNANVTGGSETVALTTSNMPRHTHSIPSLSGTTNSAGSHTHNQQGYWSQPSGSSTDRYCMSTNVISGDPVKSSSLLASGAHTHSFTTNANTTGNAGSGSAHDNMPPYLTVYMWKRID